MYPPVRSQPNDAHLDDKISQVTVIPKETTRDDVLHTSNPDGTFSSVPVPKGSKVIISIIGVHYNRTTPFHNAEYQCLTC